MMKRIQAFGGAMFIPVLLFAFAGTVVGIATLFTTQAIVGDLANPDGMWYKCWSIIMDGGWTVFNQLPLIFVVGLPIGLAKKQHARCSMESLALYLTFHYFLGAILKHFGSSFGVDYAMETGAASGLTMIANIKTLDMGMAGAILISIIVIALHNRFFDKELPEWLGVFNGSTFVYLIGFFLLIPVALLCAVVWPIVQGWISSFQVSIAAAGSFGVWIFTFLERLLIPFGLHHLLYFPFYYDAAVIAGGVQQNWVAMLPELAASTQSLKELAPFAWPQLTGLSKMFGIPGIAFAFYKTANTAKRKKVMGLLIPITLTSVICGVTEPIEFTFLFIAPALFVVHAILAATLTTIANALGLFGVMSGGLIEISAMNFIPLMKNHWETYLMLLIVGLIFTAIYYFVFKFLILKFDFKTPGRELEEEIKFYSKSEYKEQQAASKDSSFEEKILEALGGKENIVDVSNCVTRLRLTVTDASLVQNDAYFKSIGTHGVSVKGTAVQVIIGTRVAKVREKFEALL